MDVPSDNQAIASSGGKPSRTRIWRWIRLPFTLYLRLVSHLGDWGSILGGLPYTVFLLASLISLLPETWTVRIAAEWCIAKTVERTIVPSRFSLVDVTRVIPVGGEFDLARGDVVKIDAATGRDIPFAIVATTHAPQTLGIALDGFGSGTSGQYIREGQAIELPGSGWRLLYSGEKRRYDEIVYHFEIIREALVE